MRLDEKALEAAAKMLDQREQLYKSEVLARAAISTYLREAGFEEESGAGHDPAVAVRLVGPWLPVGGPDER